MFDFKNQHAIVTGGTRGIGAGITKAFLEAGAMVVATYTFNDEKAEAFRMSLSPEQMDRLILKKFDVSKPQEVESFYQWVESSMPSVQILVNNSGIRRDSMLALMADEDWRRVLEVNLDGTFYMTKKAIPLFMKNRYGRIINMSSIGGLLGLSGQANYSASKAAQMAMTKSLCKEVAKKGVTVNCIAPGFIETELLEDLSADLVAEYKKQIPMRRFGTVAEVAHSVLFLASREASYITGTTLEIHGGLA